MNAKDVVLNLTIFLYLLGSVCSKCYIDIIKKCYLCFYNINLLYNILKINIERNELFIGTKS